MMETQLPEVLAALEPLLAGIAALEEPAAGSPPRPTPEPSSHTPSPFPLTAKQPPLTPGPSAARPPTPPPAPPPAVDKDALSTGLRDLWREVLLGSVKAGAITRALLPLLHQAGLTGEARNLSRAIEGYDFDTATEVLKIIAGRLGVALES